MEAAPDRALVLAFYPSETEDRVRPLAVRLREALGLPESAAPRLVATGAAIVVEAAPPKGAEEAWTAVRPRVEASASAIDEAARPARLVSHVYLTQAAAEDSLPRTLLPEGDVIDLAPDRAPGERLLVAGTSPDRALDRVRGVLARLASARRQLEVARTYITEILKEKQVVDGAINKVLRYRIAQAKGREAIPVLEENLQEMSQHYARLTRNAWIIDGALADLRGEVEALEKEVEVLPRAGAAGRQDDALARIPAPIRAELTKLERQGRLVHESLETAKTALATHSMNVEIVRSGELLELQKSTEELQKKAVSFQSAAVLVELVVVFAYTLHSWETIVGGERFEAMGLGWFKFFSTLAFAILLCLSAHEVAHRIKEGRFGHHAKGFFAGTVVAILMMCGVTFWRAPSTHEVEREKAEALRHALSSPAEATSHEPPPHDSRAH